MGYKSCTHFDKTIGKKGIRKLGDGFCTSATNKRMCRRCPQLPAKKLSEFKSGLDGKS